MACSSDEMRIAINVRHRRAAPAPRSTLRTGHRRLRRVPSGLALVTQWVAPVPATWSALWKKDSMLCKILPCIRARNCRVRTEVSSSTRIAVGRTLRKMCVCIGGTRLRSSIISWQTARARACWVSRESSSALVAVTRASSCVTHI